MKLLHSCKYGKVEKDSFQYCKTCGKARQPELAPCHHKWEKIDAAEVKNYGNLSGTIILLQCEKCGDLKKTVMSINDVNIFQKGN